jgi:hypothetical protein
MDCIEVESRHCFEACNRTRYSMIFSQRPDERSFIQKIFFTEEGEVNRRNIFLILFILGLLGNLDRLPGF